MIQNITYRFIHSTTEQFYGFTEEQLDHRLVKIATPEKALLDLLHFQRSLYTIDLVLEKCREHAQDINLPRLFELLTKQTVAVQRIMGFLLDHCKINTQSIYGLVKTNRSISRMTIDSTVFNAKWRLYYHEHFK